MMNPDEDVTLRITESRRPKKTWRAPKMLVCDSVPQTANSKTYTPNDSYVNPNVS